MRTPLLAVSIALAACLACAAHRGATVEPADPGSLVGRIWSVREARWIDEAELRTAVTGADVVALGETHDNPEHHRVQARLLAAIVAAGRRPAVAFEMLDPDKQPAIDAAVARAPHDPDALAAAVAWQRSGWPDFALYRPVFQVALDGGLPIVAANLSRRAARQVVSQGERALSPAVRGLLDLQGPLSEAAARAYREEMQDSHCGQLPEDMLDPMVTMQRARDAQIASYVVTAARGRGAVLVAGSGHARTDRAVPSFVALAAPGLKTFSVGMLEVSSDRTAPADYASAFDAPSLPFDAVVFTQRTPREDPCRGIRERLHPPRAAPPDSKWVSR